MVGAAKNKLTELDKLISGMDPKPKKALFYCGDGRVSDDPEDMTVSTRQIETVCQILGIKHNMQIASFTYQEKNNEREQILEMMKSGDLDGIVAIRCLDEGIDLPALESGFILASSSNPRQFIQRRGRLLRKSEGKTKAVIYDFVVAPPQSDSNEQYFNIERRMFRSELKRIDEFCQTALNQFEASKVIRDLRIRYNLLGNL